MQFKKRFRSLLFWLHLALGLGAGIVITIMAGTGAILAFEDQILDWVEPSPRISPAEAALVPPFHPTSVISRIEAAYPGDRVTSIRLHADPHEPYWVRFAEQDSLYLHPGTLAPITREPGAWREFFRFSLRLHRWLAAPRSTEEEPRWWNRHLGNSIVSWATVAFLFLCLSGLYLWWPRKLNWRSLRQATRLRLDYRGIKRDWNWHNVIGFWCLLPLVIISLTGLAIAFAPVRDFIYPGSAEPKLKITAPTPNAPGVSPDFIFEQVVAAVPDWNYMIFYLPRLHDDGTLIARPLTIYTRTPAWPADVYTPLRFDPYTGELLRLSNWDNRSLTQRLRALNDYLHTGEAFGWVGQAVALAACLGALVLIYTGVALSWRRFRPRRLRS